MLSFFALFLCYKEVCKLQKHVITISRQVGSGGHSIAQNRPGCECGNKKTAHVCHGRRGRFLLITI